jgi:hypothetical protein
MNKGIVIDYETSDRITVSVLKEDYLMVRDNIRNIESRMESESNISDYIQQDYKYDKKLLKAIKRVLAYHLTKDEVDNFIQENK